MTISIVEVQSASQPPANSRVLTFDASWTPQVNDLVVLWVMADAIVTSVNVAAGWVNALGGSTFVTSDSNVIACVYHFVTPTEATAVTRTYTASGVFSNSRAGATAGAVLRGVSTTTPIDSASSSLNSGDTTTPHVLKGLTGANLSTGSQVLSCIYPDGNVSYSTPVGWTQQVSQVITVGRNVWLGSRDTLTTASTDIADVNITPSGGDEYASITLAFTAAGSVTVQPSGASLTITGSAPSVVPPNTIQPASAALTLTGGTPQLAQQFSMSLGIGQSELPWGLQGTATTADVARVCQEVAAVGARSIRMSALWLQIDPNRNHKYQWANLDKAIAFAESVGLEILLIVEPRRSVLPIGVSATLDMAKDYGLLCGAIAQRFAGRIAFYEIGNEINNMAFFGAPKTPAKYLNFLREAFTNIMAADPAAQVLAGALQAVATGWPTLHPVEWVQAFYDSNPQEWFHGISMHPYSTDGTFAPVTPTPDNEYAFKNIDAIRAIMDANGDGPDGANKKIFCTEWGYDSMRTLDGLATTDAELEAEQARNIQTHWDILKTYQQSGAIHPTTWVFMGRDWEQPNKKAQNHFGFLHFDYTPKAARDVVRSLAGPREIEATPTAVTVTGWDAEVEVFVDPTIKKPHAGAVTATGWDASVSKPVTPSSGAVAVQGWPPFINKVTDVQVVSVGAGDRDIADGDNDVTLVVTADVTTRGCLLVVGLGVSSSNLKPWELYSPFTVTSNIDGALVRAGSTHIGSASVKRGSTHAFTLDDPGIGTHTITIRVANADALTHFTSVAANAVVLRGASGTGTVASERSGSGGNTPHVEIASAVDNMVLFIACGATDFTGFKYTSAGVTSAGTVLHSVGSTVDGNGDFFFMGSVPGSSLVKLDTTNTLTHFGLLAIDVQQGVMELSDADPPPDDPEPPAETRPSGLSETFLYADPATSQRSVLDYGAVINNTAVNSRTGINACIAACSAGQEVYLPDGTYYIKGGASGLLTKSGVSIRGESQTGVVLASVFTSTAHSVIYVPLNATNFTISNLSIRKQSGSKFDTGIRFYNANLSATSPAVTRCAIRNVTIQHHDRGGIVAQNTKHLLVENCTIKDALSLDGGGSGYGVTLDGPACSNNTIQNNTIGPVIRHGVVPVDLAHHNLITGNTIVGCVSGAIDCHGEIEYSNEISYNIIHDNVRDGTTISPNGAGIEVGEPPTDEVLGGSGHGKSGPYQWIHHNEIYNCPQGIRVMNQSNYTYIEDNNCHGCDDGILIDQTDGYPDTGVDHPYILRNTLTGNINGIRLIDTVTNADVEDNIVTGNSGYGIFTDGKTTGYLITGNTVSGNGTNVSLGSADGVYVP